MKNQILFLLLLSTCALLPKQISGQNLLTDQGFITQKQSVSTFDRLRVSSAMEVTIEAGTAHEVEFTCQKYVLPYVRLNVKDGELSVSLSKQIRRKGTRAVQVTIHVNKLTQICANQAASIGSKLPIQTNQLTILLDEASGLSTPVIVNTMSINLKGSSSASLRGSVRKTFLTLTGSSQFSAESLSIARLDAQLMKASQASVFVTDTLSASAEGVSVLTFRGNPVLSSQITNGQAIIRQRNPSQ